MGEGTRNHRRLNDGGNDLQGAAALRAVFEIDIEDAQEPSAPNSCAQAKAAHGHDRPAARMRSLRVLERSPRAGQKVLSLQTLPSRPAQSSQALCANAHGFSLHAAVRCGADQRKALEHLCRYITPGDCQ